MDDGRFTLREMSREIDKTFGGRLKEAAEDVGVAFTPQSLGTFLGVDRRKVAVWMADGLPRADKIFEFSRKFNVDPEWFATGKGSKRAVVPSDGLQGDEHQLLDRYRNADPRWRLSLQLLSALAVEDQIVAATDVNMVVARIAGMKPGSLKPIADHPMREILKQSPEGWPPKHPSRAKK